LKTEDLAFFRDLAGARSFADAARRAGVSPAAVSLRLRQIETRLGVRLIDRSPRRMLLTDEGLLLKARAEKLLADLEAAERELRARRRKVAGTLRVLAPIGFGRAHIAPVVSAFKRRFEDVSVELTLSDRLGRLPEEAWDLAIHIGGLPDTRLVARRVAPNERWICAAPSYLARTPSIRTPDDLAEHRCIALRENDEDVTYWRFASGAAKSNVRINPSLATNDGDVAKSWALEGQGIIMRSEWSVAEVVASGRLTRLLADWRLADAPVFVLTASRTQSSARIDAFVGALRSSLAKPPWRLTHSPPGSRRSPPR
ncbi:MAG: LysR family transcriptional regulator, partial [Tagaea sp.]